MAREYYEILEIVETATETEIKRAYRKKAMEYHPDRNPGNAEAEAKFKKINEAYSVLSDPQKRANYDQFGSADGAGFGGFGSGFGGGFEAHDFSDIFSQFFGGGFGGRSSRNADIGEDIHIRMKISLEDALKGVSRKVEFNREILCEACDGKGGTTKQCTTCHGQGVVRERVQTVFGAIEQTRTCPDCHGTGEQITDKCDQCGGAGKISEKIEKMIEVPKGIEDGMRLRHTDEGHSGRDRNGDLYITFSVANEEKGLIRKGKDLHFSVKFSPAEAALGTKKTVLIPIIGKKELHIRAGTQTGEQIVFKHEGFDDLNGFGKGNLIITLTVEIPTRLSTDQKKLYEALQIAEGGKPKKWWLKELLG